MSASAWMTFLTWKKQSLKVQYHGHECAADLPLLPCLPIQNGWKYKKYTEYTQSVHCSEMQWNSLTFSFFIFPSKHKLLDHGKLVFRYFLEFFDVFVARLVIQYA